MDEGVLNTVLSGGSLITLILQVILLILLKVIHGMISSLPQPIQEMRGLMDSLRRSPTPSLLTASPGGSVAGSPVNSEGE